MLRISISILLLFSVTHAQIEETMKEKLAQFAVTNISYNQKLLDDKQKQVVENLYYASKIIDKIFLKTIATEPKMDETVQWLDKEQMDDRLLASCFEVIRDNLGTPILLVTRDMNLENKAELARIPYIEPPEPKA